MKMKKLACFATVMTAVGVCVFLTFDGAKPGAETDVSVPSKLIAAASPSCALSPSGVGAFQLATNQTATVRGTKPYVLTSDVPFQKSLRVAAEKLGARTVGMISPKALLIEADAATQARLASDVRFTGASEYVPSQKLSPELAAALNAGAESVQVAVVTLAAADRVPVQRRIMAAGGEILAGCLNAGDSFRATLSAKTVSDLVASGDVRWLETYERPQLLNDHAVEPAAMNVTSVWASVEFHEGLSGANQIISTSDSGVDLRHPDLTNQVAKTFVNEGCDVFDVQGHGTHTAGSIAGDGTMSTNQIRGVAWGAKLLAWFCGKASEPRAVYHPADYAKLFRPDEEQVAYIHSASWGSSQKGEYTDDCQKLDEFVWQNPDFLPVFSAGNDGSGAGTVGSPAAAKNVLSVGATQSTRSGTYGGWPSGNPAKAADFSSRGPCKDGRIKPEICAPGVGILSTRAYEMKYSYGVGANTNYAYDCGTSMSCPLTAGAMALVREWLLNQGFTNDVGEAGETVVDRTPTAALMKAVITGGAKGAERPGNEQGWGRVNLAETLFPSDGRAVKLVDRIPFAEGEEFTWVVRTLDEAPLDVQLAWIDYPGDSAKINDVQLVNDLDLTVEELEQGDGTTRFGNGGSAADYKNNLESVRIGAAPKDLYLITVKCRRILHDHTEGGAAALYIRGAIDPDEEVKGAERVRIVTDAGATTNGYYSLDKALEEVQAGETIEILKPVNLRKTCTNAVDCAIVATNGVPADALVTRVGGAQLVVAADAALTLSNVVFNASRDVLVNVLEGGQLVVDKAVDLGVAGTAVAVMTRTTDGFVLRGAPTGAVTLRCTAAQNEDETFGACVLDGTFDAAAANAAAPLIVNAYDENRELRGSLAADGTLVWKTSPCPLSDAAGVLVIGGATNAYARLDRVAEELEKALAAGETVSEVVLRKSDTLTRKLAVTADLTIRGESGVTIALQGADAGIVAAAGQLTIDDLVFEGYDGKGAVLTVDGGRMTLGEGVVLRDIVGWSDHSAALFVRQGAATSAATFLNCRNGGKGPAAGGGAITVGCPDTWTAGNYALVLTGGRIAGCWAQVNGGGVFAYEKASVTIGGPLTVKGNWVGTDLKASDIGIYNNKVKFKLATEGLTGTKDGVGIRRIGSGMSLGDSFVEAAGLSAAAVEDSAYALFNDANPDLGVARSADGKTLQWTEPVAEDHSTTLEPDKFVRVVRPGSELDGKFYRRLDWALEALTNDSPTAAATIEVLKDITLPGMAVGFPLTICSPGSVARTATRHAPDAKINVSPNGTLTLSNVTFACGTGWNGLLFVDGGTLTLDAGATICNAIGSEDRASGAVTVWNGATFNMLSGAMITNCVNRFWNAGTQNGYGGGLLVDNKSIANLLGGRIVDCASGKGGVFVNNGSRINLSGDVVITGSLDRDGNASNLCVSEDSELWVVGPLAAEAEIGYSDSARGSAADSNIFGFARKAASLTDVQIADAARRFCHDLSGDCGQAVRKSGATLYRLVWGAAIVDGKYIAPDGTVYQYGGKGTAMGVDKPTAVTELVYTGLRQTGVAAGVGYTLSGTSEATEVGNYVTTVTLGDGFAWNDGSSAKSFTLSWSIAKADYDLSGVTFVTNYVYDGSEKRVKVEGALPDGLTVELLKNSGERVNAGTYGPVTAVFSGCDANHNAPADRELWLVIEKAEYDLSGVVFEDGEFVYDRTPKSLELVTNSLPDGVTLDHYEGNGVIGTNASNEEFQVLAYLVGDEKNHVAPIPALTATLSIVRNPDMLAHDSPPPPPGPTVVTNTPDPIAFQSISSVDADTWTLVVTNRVPYCNYRILYTDDLTKGFVNTGAWEQAIGTADEVRVWTTNVVTGGGQWYWKAEATEGTNVVIGVEGD